MKTYLFFALLIFMAAAIGSDVYARITIAEKNFTQSLSDVLQLDAIQGLIFLFAPFVGIAMICGYASKSAKTRTIGFIYCLAMAILFFFYFDGFQTAQRAALEKKWTAAALSVGLLPFFIGIPMLVIVSVATAIAKHFDRRSV